MRLLLAFTFLGMIGGAVVPPKPQPKPWTGTVYVHADDGNLVRKWRATSRPIQSDGVFTFSADSGPEVRVFGGVLVVERDR